jgi:hypothetical protein
MIFKTAIISFITLYLFGGTAIAGSSLDFLKAMDGKYRGRGKVTLVTSNKEERVSCRIENSFDNQNQQLVMSGECATTLGKTSVQGTLTFLDGAITGSFIAPFPDSELTDSNSEFIEDKLIIITAFMNNESGETWRIRQTVSASDDGGFQSLFQNYDPITKVYEDTGEMNFTRQEQ